MLQVFMEAFFNQDNANIYSLWKGHTTKYIRIKRDWGLDDDGRGGRG